MTAAGATGARGPSGLLAPVAIGGLGGSGTRAVAAVVRGLGVFLGHDLNPALDNRAFTLLFKDAGVLDHPGRCARRARILARVLRGQPVPPPQLAQLAMRAVHVSLRGHDYRRSGRGVWPLRRLALMARPPQALPPDSPCGWKEPNTHMVLPGLSAAFPGLTYLHVIRHGLEVASSSNQAQLYNWGARFGVVVRRPADEPQAALRYWVRANRRALAIGRRLGPDRFLRVDYNRLCRTPEQVVTEIAAFLRIPCDATLAAGLAQLISARPRRTPVPPPEHFAPSDIAALRELGY